MNAAPRPVSHPFLRHRDSTLCALPSRHYSLEFAALALAADLRRFDRICLELPCNLPLPVLLDAARRLAGAPGALLRPRGPAVPMPVPESVEDHDPQVRRVFSSDLLPLAHDSILSTLRAVAAWPDALERVELIDCPMGPEDSEACEAPELMPGIEAQEMLALGLEAWTAKWRPVFLSSGRTPRNQRREAAMAARLRQVLDAGEECLFICGAAHWPHIQDLLDAGPLAVPPPRPPCLPPGSLRLVALDAPVLYSWHFMDIPHLAGQFETGAARDRHAFPRDEMLTRMLAGVAREAGGGVSARELENLEVFKNRQRESRGVLACDLDQHLLPAARAAAGSTFADLVERAALSYPIRPPDSVPLARVVPAGEGAYFILTPDEVHRVVFPDLPSTSPADNRPFRAGRPQSLTPRERARLDDSGGITMKPPCEERLHKHLCDTARWHAHQRMPVEREYRPRLYRGDLKAGVDWRRTLRDRARGGTGTFVRQRVRDQPAGAACDECPVVWIFDAKADIVHRIGDYFPDEDGGGRFYSSFFWFSRRERVDRVIRNEVAYLVRLHRNITPSWERERVRRLLHDRLPVARRCREEPWDDESLPPGLHGPDLAVASAVRWAMTDHVGIVNADPSYQVGEPVHRLAAGRGVRLVMVEPSSLNPILLRRYHTDHEVPSRGSWHPPEPLVLRFVDPVPGLEDHFRL